MKEEEKGRDLGKEVKEKQARSKNAFMNIKPPASIISLKNNNLFCSHFLAQNNMATITDDPVESERGGELVYDFSHTDNFDSEAFGKIIDILSQLRATEDDRNILVQNNTVLREQILNQLKNEVLRVKHKLTKNQIKNLEVVSSNNFDKDALTDILRSLLESSKKKSARENEEIGDTELHAGSKLVTLEKVSKNYLTILDKVNYYEKIVDKVLKHVSHKTKEVDVKSPELTVKQDAAQVDKSILKKKSVKNIFDKVSKFQDVKILEEINKFYEENLVNKMGLLPRIINLQSKVSEMNILTKVGTFVENIVQKSVPKFITSETELINKVIHKTNIEELRENIAESQKQYIEDKSFQERNISRLYSEVRKLYNTKTLNKNVTEVLKHIDYKKINLEEHVKKNLLKLTTKKDVINKFKNIYSDAVQDVSVTRTEDRSELINRTGTVTEVNEEEKTALKEIVNLRRSGITINKQFTENIHQNNVLMKDIRLRQKKIKNIHSNLERINNVFTEDTDFTNNILSTELITKDHLTKTDVENYVERVKHTKLTERKAKTYKNKIKEITDEVKEQVTKDIIDVHEKEIHRKFKQITHREKINLLKTSGIKPIVNIQTPGKDKVEVWNKEDVYKFIPIHVKENILEEKVKENVRTHDVMRFLPDRIFRDRKFKIDTKDIYRNIARQHIDKYIEKSYDLQKEYLINRQDNINRQIQHNHIDERYMVYKEDRHYPQEPEQVEKKKAPESSFEKGEERVDIKEKVIPKPFLDTKKIEKNILAKTLSKSDIVNLIESYMKDIDVNSISRKVIEQVDEKMKFDKQRVGIF